jgi:predicted transcriptional regulator
MQGKAKVPVPRKENGRQIASQRTWYLLSSHGTVFFYVATHPDCTIKEMTEALFLTRRTIWGLVGDLRKAGMVDVRKSGRRHHYSANPDSQVHHPVFGGRTVREVIEELVQQGWQLLGKPRR